MKQRRPTTRQQATELPWYHRWYFAANGLVLAAGVMASPGIRVWAYLAVAASALAAIVVGIRRYRPVWSRPWWLTTGAIGMSLLANVGWAAAMTPTGVPLFPSWGDLCYAATLILLTTSVYLWVRPGAHDRGLIDAAIVSLGGAAVLWVLVVAPLMYDAPFTGLRLGTYLSYSLVDLIILALTVRVVVVSRVRTVAHRLVVAAAGLFVLTDTVYYAVLLSDNVRLDRTTAIGWLGAYMLIGGAALHPSMARSVGAMPTNAVQSSRSRLWTYAVLTAMISMLIVVAVEPDLPHDRLVRLIVLVVVSCATSVMLILRLSQLAGLLTRRVQVDTLTGLANRIVVQDRLDRGAPRDEVLLLVDLDGFRDFNEAFGHQDGDAVLVEIGHRIRAAVPSDAIVARLGADDYAILTAGDGHELAERILAATRRPVRIREEISRTFRASIGILELPAGGAHTTALRDADLALASARGQGGNRSAAFDPGIHAERRANSELITQLHDALAADEFTMNYQPIVDLATERIVAAEALLRWTRPDGTRVPPDRFIPLAEQSGAIVAIGDWVLAQVCADLAGLWSAHRLSVTVNVSAHQLRDPAFADRVLTLLAAGDVPGHALIVEITETVLVTSVSDAATVAAQLQRLRDHGVRIAIDDFGTGYSSLAYLRELPVDILKMDGSFTARQIEHGGPREVAFIRTIVELGRSLDLVTIAEAVETDTQAARLRGLGCALAQGYHFAKPGPLAELLEHLHQQCQLSARPAALS
ncbi:putative bifunctional diguanylate cyclase/phosphodiesterase [Actinoplanes sp. NPDC051859]|uniref:putative bifunctional diguanylate cyclase/phosphodiesterase n=1 Tax=Actinoplanes sp. NPDC051859 TaxID=3363909 RepID=UPI00378CD77B